MEKKWQNGTKIAKGLINFENPPDMKVITHKSFNPDTISSLSAHFISKTKEFKDINKAIKFDIWDTTG